MPPPDINNPKKFKSQPWILFDTIASRSFLMGDPVNLAIGSQTPAISQSGEIVFFQSAGRTRASMPFYTNLDVPGQLAYGLRVWQIYVMIAFPQMVSAATVNPNAASTQNVSTAMRLAEAILNYSVLQLNLGQEDQIEWPLTRFGGGGGLAGQLVAPAPLNSQAQSANVLKLPEPIEMGRTQNLSAKIRLAPEVFEIIGNPTNLGVGQPLELASIEVVSGAEPVLVTRRLPPFSIQLGLQGQRIKLTQYGQEVRTSDDAG
jgi:hypothetical protein